MIPDFDDFCTWMDMIVDDIWLQIASLFKRPGPAPTCSDSELISMALVGECRGWDVETEMLSHWHDHQDLFPHIPSQSRFNRRRRNLMHAFNLIRRIVLQMLDVAEDSQCVIDTLPIPVVQFYLVPSSTGDWQAYGSTFGKVPAKSETIFGYKLHLLTTVGGVILDFELAPAHKTDLAVAYEMLVEHSELDVLGDKAYISADKAAKLGQDNRLRLPTLPRRNQKKQLSPYLKQLYNRIRQVIETVNGQLSEQFNIEHNHAHTFWGLGTRLYTKLTAHTLCGFNSQVQLCWLRRKVSCTYEWNLHTITTPPARGNNSVLLSSGATSSDNLLPHSEARKEKIPAIPASHTWRALWFFP